MLHSNNVFKRAKVTAIQIRIQTISHIKDEWDDLVNALRINFPFFLFLISVTALKGNKPLLVVSFV